MIPTKEEDLKIFILAQLTGFINEPITNPTKEEIKNFILKLFPTAKLNFTVKQNELDKNKMDIVPYDLATGVFLKEGLHISPDKKDRVDTLYGTYSFENGNLYFTHNKPIERIHFTTTIKEAKNDK
jgi:hypothetical protein